MISFKLKFLILTCFMLCSFKASISIDPFTQVTWLIAIDEDTYPRTFHFGIKNLHPQEDSNYYNLVHVQQRDPYYLAAIVRTQDEKLSTYSSKIFMDDHTNINFNEQHLQYFLNADLSSYSGYYYVLKDDPLNCVTPDVDINYNTFCETRFSVRFFNNYRKARREFERLENTDNTSEINSPYRIIFGGPDGILDSTDIDYFLKNYLSAWCPYYGGILNKSWIQGNAENFETRWHIYLGNNLGVTDQYYLPISVNNRSDATDECRFLEGDDELTFIAAELFPNCYVDYNTSPGQINQLDVDTKTYTLCGLKFWDMQDDCTDDAYKPRYYEFEKVCHKNDRTFIQLRSLYEKNITVTFGLKCSNQLNGYLEVTGQTRTFIEFYDEGSQIIFDGPVTTISSNTQSFSCTYENLNGYNDCKTRLTYTCYLTSLTPSYFDYVNLNPITSIPARNVNASGSNQITITDSNLRVYSNLNLYDPRDCP